MVSDPIGRLVGLAITLKARKTEVQPTSVNMLINQIASTLEKHYTMNSSRISTFTLSVGNPYIKFMIEKILYPFSNPTPRSTKEQKEIIKNVYLTFCNSELSHYYDVKLSPDGSVLTGTFK